MEKELTLDELTVQHEQEQAEADWNELNALEVTFEGEEQYGGLQDSVG